MQQIPKTIGLVALATALTAVLVSLVIPGCFRQNQDNSPITVNNSSGRTALSVTCSQDGSVAYVTDGRNVYRYERLAPGEGDSWECILSYRERLEMAAKHDPREQLLLDGLQEKAPDTKPSSAGPQNTGK